MAAVLIGRTAMTDDDGTSTVGTAFNNAWKTALYDQIDAMLATVFTSTTELKSTVVTSSLNILGATVYIGDTSNANSAAGLTINQGAADDAILSLKSSDVAHGMTSQAETDTYVKVQKAEATNGAMLLKGLGAGNYGIVFQPYYTTDTATRSTAGIAPFLVDCYLKSGTTGGSPAADKNIVAFASGGNTRFILDSDGDSFQDVGTAWTQFDTHDDVLVLNSLAAEVSRKGDPWKARIRRYCADSLDVMLTRKQMQDLKLVTFNRDGHHFVNMSKLAMLNTGAIRQIAQEQRKMRQALVGARLLEA
jgi:hypothetical protein